MLEPALISNARVLARQRNEIFDTLHCVATLLLYLGSAEWAGAVLAASISRTQRDAWLRLIEEALATDPQPPAYAGGPTIRYVECERAWAEAATEHRAGLTEVLVIVTILRSDGISAGMMRAAGVDADALVRNLEVKIAQLDADSAADVPGSPGAQEGQELAPTAGVGPGVPAPGASGVPMAFPSAAAPWSPGVAPEPPPYWPYGAPIPEGHASWPDYWAARGTPWRTEPEIAEGRQRELAAYRTREPDIAQSVYPFRAAPLTRADVEWLLATHESGGTRGPVGVDDPSQRTREGLDLRGAILAGADLRGLPLGRLRGGLTAAEWREASPVQRESAAVNLTGTNLSGVHLEEAVLAGAVASRPPAGSPAIFAPNFYTAPQPLQGPGAGDHREFEMAHLQRTTLIGARLDHASLRGAHLEDADLSEATLRGCDLTRAQLRGARARAAVFDGAALQDANLEGVDLRGASLDGATRLNGARLEQALLDQVGFGGVNLAVIDWSAIRTLGDETRARRGAERAGASRHESVRLRRLEGAARATLQLSTALRSQGLSEQADRFAYRARLLQRRVLRRQGPRKWPAYCGSWLLDVLAGYGYRPARSFLVYLVAIAGFASAYHVLGGLPAPDAVVFSVTSFHGRGFSPSAAFTLHDPVAVVAAIEAFLGLFIEITFIATFTQRFFSR